MSSSIKLKMIYSQETHCASCWPQVSGLNWQSRLSHSRSHSEDGVSAVFSKTPPAECKYMHWATMPHRTQNTGSFMQVLRSSFVLTLQCGEYRGESRSLYERHSTWSESQRWNTSLARSTNPSASLSASLTTSVCRSNLFHMLG